MVQSPVDRIGSYFSSDSTNVDSRSGDDEAYETNLTGTDTYAAEAIHDREEGNSLQKWQRLML
jgi:hypothetical protein